MLSLENRLVVKSAARFDFSFSRWACSTVAENAQPNIQRKTVSEKSKTEKRPLFEVLVQFIFAVFATNFATFAFRSVLPQRAQSGRKGAHRSICQTAPVPLLTLRPFT